MDEMQSMTDASEGAADRPLVTFALFAFNQEKYIREAVEGALSQTYEPLEIILSDDCSTDRTFEIMQEMAAAYQGPHRVRVRRSEVNFGTAQHVYAVSLLAEGPLLVVAAGDDVSMPTRCEEIVNGWLLERSPICCIHSAAVFFEDNAAEGRFHEARTLTLRDSSECMNFLRRDRLPFLSPTCAYSIELFRNYGPLIGGSIIEDGVMGLRSLLSGKVISIEKPLVKIRVSHGSSGTNNSIEDPTRWNRFILSQIISYANKLRDIPSNSEDSETLYEIEKDYLKKIRVLSSFFAPPNRKAPASWKLVFLYHYLFSYAAGTKISNRLADAASTLGYSDSFEFKAAIRFFKRLRSLGGLGSVAPAGNLRRGWQARQGRGGSGEG